MIYPIKTLGQTSLVLKGFRKEKGLTQAAIAERLGISQQSYAHFEANPEKATLERLFKVLRMLDVEISLNRASVAADKGAPLAVSKKAPAPKVKGGKTPAIAAAGKAKPASAKGGRAAAPARRPTRRKENW